MKNISIIQKYKPIELIGKKIIIWKTFYIKKEKTKEETIYATIIWVKIHNGKENKEYGISLTISYWEENGFENIKFGKTLEENNNKGEYYIHQIEEII